MPKRARRSGLNPIERMVRNKRHAKQQEAYLEEMANEYAGAAKEAKRRLTEYGSTRIPMAIAATGATGVYGRGRYSLGSLGRTAMGKTIGRAVIKRAASMIGGRGMYTGRGAYTANSLMSDAPPQVISTTADETGAVSVSRLEFLTEVYGPSSAFNVQSFPLNPGLEATFPWLSQIAQNYDEYEFEQLVFSFRSTTTDIGSSTTGQCGTVLMATCYDPAAAPFGDKKVMMAYDGAMSSKTTESMVHGVECDPAKLSGSQGKYVRAFGLDQSKDIKDYDHGLFQLAIANAPSAYANQSLGELWVSYTVKLRKPKFFSARGLNISRDIFVSGNGTESATFLMGTSAALLRGMCNNINCSLTLTANSVKLTFPADFAGTVGVYGRSEGVFTNNPWANGNVIAGNVSLLADIYGSAGDATDSPMASIGACTNANQATYEIHLRIAPATGGVDNSITFTTSNITSVVQSCIEIKEINSGFSYKYANIGQSDAPILVNAQGVIVVP